MSSSRFSEVARTERPLSGAASLPAGMRDLLPAEAEALSGIARTLLDCFELAGYQRVSVPVFELVNVLERGLGPLDPAELLQLVDPESGDVVALRPDVTPQVARLVATRLADRPGPARLCYEASVLRRRRERARRQRQVPQAGVELIGLPGPAGDREILMLAVEALGRAGLGDVVLDLAHAGIAGPLLALVPPSRRAAAQEALEWKDLAALRSVLAGATIPEPARRALLALPRLTGGIEILREARALFEETPAAPALEELAALLSELPLSGARCSVDLGAVTDFVYYTGIVFHLHAAGPGEAVVAGGRYDRLLGAYGPERAAAGFAVDLDHLAWALGAAGRRPERRPRALVTGAGEEELRALRRGGVVAAASGSATPSAEAAAWGYTHLVALGSHPVVVRLDGGECPPPSPEELADLAALGRRLVADGTDPIAGARHR